MKIADIKNRFLFVISALSLAGFVYFTTSSILASRDAGMLDAENDIQQNDGKKEAEASTDRLHYTGLMSSVDYESLARSDLFMLYGAPADEGLSPENGEKNGDEEVSASGIRLLGTVAGSGRLARALIRIESAGGCQRFYRIGDTVQGFEIEKIGPRNITLSRGGALHEVGMDFTGVVSEPAARPFQPSGSDVSVSIVGRGGEVRVPDQAARYLEEAREERAARGRGRWGDMDEEERERRVEQMRERRERYLESLDSETRERIVERIRETEERVSDERGSRSRQ